MTRCLSDRALTRVLAELGTADERAHVAVCAACGDRYRRLARDVADIARALGAAPEPGVVRRPAPWRWAAAAATVAAVAAGAWLWTDAGSRGRPEPTQDPRVAMAMADITTVLFSVDGEPRRRAGALEADAVSDATCDAVAPNAGMYCPGGAIGLSDATDGPDLDTPRQFRGPEPGRGTEEREPR